MAKVGIEKLYYALLTKDDAESLTYGTPKYLAGVREINIKPATSTEKLYAENKIWEQETVLSEIQVDIDIADLTNDDLSILVGHKKASQGGIIGNESDNAPYVALLVKANKTNKQARYLCLYKGKFTLPEDSAKTKEDKTEYQTPKISGIFQPTIKDGNWKYQVDTDDEDCPEDIDTSFFASVIIPTIPTP